MFQTLKNAWAMPELRKKILYTLFIILIFRFGSCIPVPFIDTQLLAQYFEQASTNGSMLGYLDMFSGGGLSRATIFAMSITPYINASIILQLLTVAIPALERMVKDGGEEGRKKIASWTRYVGVLLGLLQGLSYYALLRNQGFLSDKGVLAAVTIIMTFTAGTALIMWMGEHITQKGIGNGISIILFAGIVSRGPSLMRTLGNLFQTGTSGIVSAILMIIIGIFIVVFIVFMSNAERRISPPICRSRSTLPALCRSSLRPPSSRCRRPFRCSGSRRLVRSVPTFSICSRREVWSTSFCTRC